MAKSQWVSFGAGSQNDNLNGLFSIVGDLRRNTSEDQAEAPVRVAGTFSYFRVVVTANPITAATSATFTLRKSQADTALEVVYGASETGAKVDTGSASYANTDEVCVRLVTASEAGTVALTFSVLEAVFEPSSGSSAVTALLGSAGNVYNTSARNYRALTGNMNWNASEATVQTVLQGTFTASNLRAIATSNTLDVSAVLMTRLNGSDGALTVTFAAAETGVKEDVTHSDSIVPGDLYNLVIEAAGRTAGSIGLRAIAVVLTSANAEFPLVGSETLAQSFNVTNNVGLTGALDEAVTTEAHAQSVPGFNFRVTKLSVIVSANTIATSASTIAFRIDGGNGNQVISYAAAETGQKTDTDVDAVTTANALNYQIVTPNTSGTLTIRSISAVGFQPIFSDSVSDGLVLGDSPAATADVTLALADGLVLGDAASGALQAALAASDGLILGDAAAAAAQVPAAASDGILLSDSLAAQVAVQLAVAEGLVLGDTPSAAASIPTALSDGLVLGDDPTAVRGAFMQVSDGLVLGDALTTRVTVRPALTDGIRFGDSALARIRVNRSLADGIVFGDAIGTFVPLPAQIIHLLGSRELVLDLIGARELTKDLLGGSVSSIIDLAGRQNVYVDLGGSYGGD